MTSHLFCPCYCIFFGICWFFLVHPCVCFSMGKKSAWHQKLLCVVTDYCNGKHLTQPPGLNSMKKKKREEDRTKRRVSDFQKPLKTEPQRPAEPRGAKWHQQPAAERAFIVTFTFLCLHGLHDSQHETTQLSPDRQSHSSQLHVKNVITEISNIRFQPLCLTSACCGNGLICAFNNFNHPCKCVWSYSEKITKRCRGRNRKSRVSSFF